MHEERGKTARKTYPDAGMGDGWSKIQVRNTPCHRYLINRISISNISNLQYLLYELQMLRNGNVI